MTIPTYDALMLPVLKHCAKKPWVMRDLVARIADDFHLTEDERDAQIPSGTTVISSRVHWAKTYLKQAGLIDQPKRGVAIATETGKLLLAQKLSVIDLTILQRYEKFNAFWKKTKTAADLPGASKTVVPISAEISNTPEEQIDTAAATLMTELRDVLLERVLEASPIFFERLIIDLLLSMGYGGSRKEAGTHLGRTGDGGVDGVIQEDQLGLDRIYLQAKR